MEGGAECADLLGDDEGGAAAGVRSTDNALGRGGARCVHA